MLLIWLMRQAWLMRLARRVADAARAHARPGALVSPGVVALGLAGGFAAGWALGDLSPSQRYTLLGGYAGGVLFLGLLVAWRLSGHEDAGRSG
jgi:hypothetical protein